MTGPVRDTGRETPTEQGGRVVGAFRRFYWKRIRRYRYELCGTVNGRSPGRDVIRRYGCGRPVGVVWTAPTLVWDEMVAPGERSGGEGVGGILCLQCFDRVCEDRMQWWRWVPQPIDEPLPEARGGS